MAHCERSRTFTDRCHTDDTHGTMTANAEIGRAGGGCRSVVICIAWSAAVQRGYRLPCDRRTSTPHLPVQSISPRRVRRAADVFQASSLNVYLGPSPYDLVQSPEHTLAMVRRVLQRNGRTFEFHEKDLVTFTMISLASIAVFVGAQDYIQHRSKPKHIKKRDKQRDEELNTSQNKKEDKKRNARARYDLPF